MAKPFLIIGAGLSGLAAALEIEAAGESCVIFDSASHVGGKLETSVIEDCYRLDRGFQVLLPAYPELRELENLKDLDLQYFSSGSRLELPDQALIMADPFRHPKQIFSTAFGSYASIKDKFLVWSLQRLVSNKSEVELLARSNLTTADFLIQFGFSEAIINNFWTPFFRGIFLEANLETSAGFFLFLVKMFGESPVAVPKKGIQELPKLLASKLKRTEIRLGERVKDWEKDYLTLASGERIHGNPILSEEKSKGPFGQVTSFWFAAKEAPYQGKWLSLVPRNTGGRINHVAVLSSVSSEYALNGDALVCVNCIGILPSAEITLVVEEATRLYGNDVKYWRHLRTDYIPEAFPLYLSRSDLNTPSQQGAMSRGRRIARTALAI